MSHKKTSKKAFTMAALVILLCLASLIGATFALFTSNPEDGTIGIIATAGDVSVEIVDENNVSLKDKVLEFVTTTGKQDFLFEPGATLYTQGFRVQNTGDIPVKFSVSVSKDESKSSEYWAEFDEAFEIWVTSDLSSPEKAREIRAFDKLLNAKTTSDVYYLVVKMKETASNDFQNCEFSGIGITVYAVQGNAE